MSKISPVGIELIKQFEGLELESYLDIADVWTIGYGHTETAGPNQKITEREAEELLRRDLVSREQAVSNLSNVPLNQNEFDALVSFVYNVGSNAFRGSTARKRLNREDRMGAADALTWWNKATVDGVLVPVRGLTRRRAAERALFLTPVNRATNNDLSTISENSRIQPLEDPPRRGNLAESRTIQGASVAGGAGVASTTMGRETANEIDDLEDDIANGDIPNGSSGTQSDSAGQNNDAGAPLDNATSDDATADNGIEESGAAEDQATSGDDTSSEDMPSEDTGDAPLDDAAPEDGDAAGASEDTGSDADASDDSETETFTEAVEEEQPSYIPDQHEAEAQIQFALMLLIIFSVIFVIYARVEDWFAYKR